MKALLICNLGVSTKMLKEKIEEVFTQSGEDFELMAQPRSNLEDLIDKIDIVLVAPQIMYLKDEIFELCETHHKKCLLIPFQLYGNMDGEGVAALMRKTMAA